MIHVTFPDGAERAFEPGVSGLDIAKSISPSLAKRAVAAIRDGELVDLADPVDETRTSNSSPATTRAPFRSSATMPRTCWPKRCSRCGPARR